MGDRAYLNITDAAGGLWRGGTLATFYSHNGGSPLYMLTKIATWRAENPAAPVTDLIRWVLANPHTKLELCPRDDEVGFGDRDHIYRVRPLADLRDDGCIPLLRIDIEVRHGDNRIIEGNTDLFATAARELRDAAARAVAMAERQGWDDATRNALGYDPKVFLDEAKKFDREAARPEPIPALF